MKKAWQHLEEVICVVIFIVMLVLGFSNVVVRTMTNYSLASTQEIVINGMVALTLYGSAIAIKRGQLLAVGFLIDNVTVKVRRLLQVVISVAIISTLVVILYYMVDLLSNQYQLQIRTSALQTKAWYYTVILPPAFVLMIIRQLEWLSTQFKRPA
ncbi:TRAP transporter small permease subunit [Vibrio astriarenae]|uniref:TRAP transporter small permease protein n=1 Tax=Vibrio astriarenae TaxID=1481923 RepID=A0A7Z2YDP5_9VIBR|nr:TRAP transporter small permease subunit [Vibrio astriarenae]QIA63527.1 TRAP transporter small permease subunit [Vibrio astriarenae]